MNAWDALGQEGGGTLYLGPGTFTVNETLNFQGYNNVSIQGSGMGRTVLSLPVDPVGNFSTDNGSAVGQYNATTGGPVNGTTANFIDVTGSTPMDNFALCNLELNAQANNVSSDWAGSLIYDDSGGAHHVYTDVAEDGFFGPSTTPNGLHLEPASGDAFPASGYIIDGLYAEDNAVPFENYSGYRGGPNFLNVGPVVNCTLDQVVAIGLVAFEVAPARACTIENWNVAGHMLIDPATGGSWEGTVFRNITVDENGTAAPNALGISVNAGSGGEASNFTDLRWVDDTFVGTVLGGPNMIDVENSTFWGAIDPTPAIFENDFVYWADQSANRLTLPVITQGTPTGGVASVLTGDTFVFPNGTSKHDPFQLTAPVNHWTGDTVMICGAAPEFLLDGPDLQLSANSTFSHLTYVSLGNDSPVDLLLFDELGSPGFTDDGAAFWSLTGIFGDLPEITPSPAGDLDVTAPGPSIVDLNWSPAEGPVTNYSVQFGINSSALGAAVSAGNATGLVLSGLTPNTTYFAAVTAWNGTHGSDPSPISEVTTPDWAPAIPSDLAVMSTASQAVDLSWSPARGTVSNYSVLIGESPTDLTRSYSMGTSTQGEVSGLAPATTYYFEVDAWNGTWSSGPSAPIHATTLTVGGSPPPHPPAGPAPLTAADLVSVLATTGILVGVIVVPILLLSIVRSRRGPSR